MHEELKKIKHQKANNPVNKWQMNRTDNLQMKEIQMAKKCIKMLNIFSHGGNVNENYTEILSHPSQNSCHQENKQ
jgi:hypothetical protein